MPSLASSPSTDTGAPAVERAVQVLLRLGQSPRGLSVQALAEATGTPRATLYRIVRVLSAHGIVVPGNGQDGLYRLGPTLARLGMQVAAPRDLVTLARPVMQELAGQVGETVKLVARDGLEVVTLAVADTELDARVTSRAGTRLPLHLGGSQRLLLAHAPAEVLRAVLAAPLARTTARTFSDPKRLRASLDKLKMTDSVQGHGEGLDGVGAAGTLVRGAGDEVLGALVAVYIHTGKSAAQLKKIALSVEEAAQDISSWQLTAQTRS